MLPPYPPLPTPWNLAFHAATGGIHTSNPIFEPAVGVAVASTRQKAGSVIGVRIPGAVKGPAATSPAAVILTPGIVRLLKSAHALPRPAAWTWTKIPASGTAQTIAAQMRRNMIASPKSVIGRE